ncbi:unnamed protein product [Closterium sp. NIES-64]|nr:unnamed protein product [Closterium sp. NIES-64]
MADLSAELRPYEERAAKAEERLAKLEAMVGSLGSSALVGDEKAALAASLEAVKAALVGARTHVQQAVQDSTQQAQAQAAQLSEENAKLKYRVLHLSRALRDADAKLAAPA